MKILLEKALTDIHGSIREVGPKDAEMVECNMNQIGNINITINEIMSAIKQMTQRINMLAKVSTSRVFTFWVLDEGPAT